MAANVDYAKLRDQTLGSNEEEEAVTVNTRALIDKVLARYSGEWTTLRELIQNAADASASKVKIKFETLPSSSVPLPHDADPPSLLKHTVLHHTVRRLLISNNGQHFGANDWLRLKRIAEGNPDETKIGAFGVGFYSVFSECENPFVSSGREAMAFYWKGNSLFTRKGAVPIEISGEDTCFMLDYRSSSSQVPDLMSICQFLSSSLTFVGLDCIDLWLDNWNIFTLRKKVSPPSEITVPKEIETKAKEGLMRIVSIEAQKAQIDARWMNIVSWTPCNLERGRTTSSDAESRSTTTSLKTFFSRLTGSSQVSIAAKRAAKDEEDTQRAISEDITGNSLATVFTRVSTIHVKSHISSKFAAELERATKKPPPGQTKISILISSFDENAVSNSTPTGTASKKAGDLLNSILPVRNGRIFIGFPTVQTTGLLAHISAPSLIPTVERESIDLNARYVRTWNMELLNVAGIACRIAYFYEMASINDKLIRFKDLDPNERTSSTEISAVLPSAIHTLNQFSFRESTPLPRAGQLIEESFWSCHKKDDIEVLSSKGILSSREVRIASENLSFISGIPVVPVELLEDANEFVSKLRNFGFISEITIEDIQAALRKQPLSETQTEEFLKWTAQKLKSGKMNTTVISSLFEEVIVTITPDSAQPRAEKYMMLGKITTFTNSSKLSPELPLPPQTIPFKFVKALSQTEIRLFGWEELQIVPWLRWLVDSEKDEKLKPDQEITSSPLFAGVVLLVVSRAWDSLNAPSKSSVIDLLSTKTVIPTKFGMQKPSNAYFASVKLFNDLPTVSGLIGVKEKFLKALGVRKTIDIMVVLERLMKTPANSNSANKFSQWSHVDLIKYFVSVWSDIPEQDIAILRKTPLCPAEDANDRANQSGRLYMVSQLYEPNDSIRSLGLPALQWPNKLDLYSPDGKFLNLLGLQSHPVVPVLLDVLINAHSSGNNVCYEQALKYFSDNHHPNNYAAFDLRQSTKAFLPLQHDSQRLATPSTCYTNQSSSCLKYDVLRHDLRPNASKFGVSTDPSITDCTLRLVQNPPKDQSEAKIIFSYFASRLNEISGQVKERLMSSLIVPIATISGEDKKPRTHHVSPASCFLGKSDEYRQIFHYVDFENEANSFLLAVGSKHEPNIFELTQLLMREPARVLQTFHSHEPFLALLRRVHLRVSDLRKDKMLWKEMKQAQFLLASKDIRRDLSSQAQSVNASGKDSAVWDDEVEDTYKEWTLGSPKEIVVIDDVISYTLFRDHLKAAPQEDGLEELYILLGAPTVSDLVEEEYRIGPKRSNQDGATSLQTLILERSRLFLHDQPIGTVRKDGKWLEKNLKVQLVQSVSLRRSLKGYSVSHTEKRTAALTSSSKQNCILSITSDYDLWQVSHAMVLFLLERPKTQHVLLLETLLATSLDKLRSRGYNVNRILQRKAEAARIAKIEREKLEEERQRAEKQANVLTTEFKQGTYNGTEHETLLKDDDPGKANLLHQNTMPGAFMDFPEAPQESLKKPSLLSQISRRLGYDYDGRSLSAGQNVFNDRDAKRDLSFEASDASSLPPNSDYAPRPIRSLGEGEPTTSFRTLQNHLVRAIEASRPHNSSEIFAPPSRSEVKETASYCDEQPGQNIVYHATSKFGLKIFVSKTILDQSAFYTLNHAGIEMFSALILACAKAFEMAPTSLHIFHDEEGVSIAFNRRGSIFFNYRYFAQLHLPDMHRLERKKQAFVYWWVTLCHELAHNLVVDHSAGHSYYTEQFIAAYFPKVAETVSKMKVVDTTNDLERASSFTHEQSSRSGTRLRGC